MKNIEARKLHILQTCESFRIKKKSFFCILHVIGGLGFARNYKGSQKYKCLFWLALEQLAITKVCLIRRVSPKIPNKMNKLIFGRISIYPEFRDTFFKKSAF